ncbi:hypothetical protein ANCCEY_09126 [Ancylostoma ceylanicum]|uniref:Uncharacterized protein n=1 Tax=Ancylostoma ceylanicum TaxID=53326 RepID=A0A0D6LP50_9BILA|nr:hypothetical protein ANCCEY_09126 [Ancylostoma ceylanicum]
MASAPYDMAMITENCKRAKKSPCMLRDLPLEEKTLGGWDIIGHTVVLSRGFETVACATIILPGLPLLRASFHAPPVEGHIHIIPFNDMAHYFEPVRSASDFGTLHIRDDCLDMSTETVHKSFEYFYPTINIFGPDSIALKSLVADNSCGPLRPQFPRPAATANYIYPIAGRLVLVDMDDRILLTGELRHLNESSATRATVQDRTQLSPANPMLTASLSDGAVDEYLALYRP